MKTFKKIISVALVLLLSAQLTVALFAEDKPLDGKSYVSLGDSITAGYGLADLEKECFANIFAEKSGLVLNNKAVSGSKSTDVIALLDTVGTELSAADVITLTIGGNDMMGLLYSEIAKLYNSSNGTSYTEAEILAALGGGESSLSASTLLTYAFTALNGFSSSDNFKAGLEAFTASFDTLLGKIRTLNPDATLIVCTQYSPYDGLMGNPFYGKLYTEIEAGVVELNKVITSFADKYELTIADVYSAFKSEGGAALCCADVTNMTAPNLDFHPNAAGHAVIAETVYASINRSEAEDSSSDTPAVSESESETETDADTSDADTTEAETTSRETSTEETTQEVSTTSAETENAGDTEDTEGVNDPSEDTTALQSDSAQTTSAATSEATADKGGCASASLAPVAFVIAMASVAGVVTNRKNGKNRE